MGAPREPKTPLAKMLREARLSRSLSQTDLGTAIGVSQGTISAYELGDLDASGALARLLEAMKVPEAEWAAFMKASLQTSNRDESSEAAA
jgi:transcriptional regulator with XRE-family HTH domain